MGSTGRGAAREGGRGSNPTRPDCRGSSRRCSRGCSRRYSSGTGCTLAPHPPTARLPPTPLSSPPPPSLQSDRDILEHIVYDLDADPAMLEALRSSVEEAQEVQTQEEALNYLGKRGTVTGASKVRGSAGRVLGVGEGNCARAYLGCKNPPTQPKPETLECLKMRAHAPPHPVPLFQTSLQPPPQPHPNPHPCRPTASSTRATC